MAARLRKIVLKAKTAAAALTALPEASRLAGLDALASGVQTLPLAERAKLASRLPRSTAGANFSE
jgi:hypothetical protein